MRRQEETFRDGVEDEEDETEEVDEMEDEKNETEKVFEERAYFLQKRL